jgi:general stress protein 26
MDKEVVLFLLAHNLGVLSTVDDTNTVSGAAVYYALSEDNAVYIVTKAETRKFKNIHAHPQVAFTVFDGETRQTLQLQGTASVETKEKAKRDILQKIIKPRLYGKDVAWPPITKLAAGDYAVIKIMATNLQYFDYKK